MTKKSQSDGFDMDLVRREALEFAGIGLYRYAFDGRILAMDQEAFNLFELQDSYAGPSDVVGKGLPEILEYRQPVGIMRRKIRESGRIRREEFHFRTVGGRDKWALEDSYLVKDPRSGEEAIQVLTRDITDRKLHMEALRFRGEFERLITSISTTFINLSVEDIDKGINDALQAIAEFARVDRSYIILLDETGTRASNTHEWCAEGIATHQEYWQDVPVELFPWAMESVADQGIIHIARCSDHPELAKGLGELYGAVDTRSLLAVPMVLGQRLTGLLGFDAVREEKTWSDDMIALLRIVGEMFVNALERQRTQRERQRWADFRRVVTEISTRFIGITVDEVEQEVQNALRTTGEFMAVDRSYVGLLSADGGKMAEGYEWCAPGIVSFEDDLLGQDITQFRYAVDLFQRGQILHVPSVDALPPEAQAEKDLLKGQGVKSLLDVPIFHDRRLRGYLGFDSVAKERNWSEEAIALLRIVCEIFGSAFARKEAENEHRRLEAQVQHGQKLESLGVLAGGIAHDFNNLLVGILGNAGLALMRLPANSPGRESVSQIERAAMRAAELTNQLLAYSGRGQFVVQSLSLAELVEEMAHLLGTVISKKAQIERHFPPDLPPVSADPSQIRQVIMNLITNASDAMGEERGVIAIRGGTDYLTRAYLATCYLDDEMPEGEYVYFDVSDTGCGMDAETQAKIFDPFYTTKFAGRGLGLAAVLGIVRGHHGAVKVYSEPERGTSFKVFLPPSSRRPESLVLKEEGATEWQGTGTILVVDDEETVRGVAVAALEDQGFTTLVAEDGRQGVNLFRVHSEEIVAVLLDLTMPHMDGEEVLREVRGIRPGVPVVLSSGFSEQEAIRRFDEHDRATWRFLQKPFTPARLLETMRDVLAEGGG